MPKHDNLLAVRAAYAPVRAAYAPVRAGVCSDDFCHLTQYPRTEVLGRNCKFLQVGERASPAG